MGFFGMRDKVCLITGANAGIGKAVALGLARLGARVVMVCRSRARGEAAQKEIEKKSGAQNLTLLVADLSEGAAIANLNEAFRSRFDRLHVLINNAAVLPRRRTVTGEGLELQFAVNHLAYFRLTLLFLDVLKKSAPSRIVNVASNAHAGAALDFEDLQSERSYHRTKVYGRTKLANILFTYELARRLEGTDLTVNCLHPGVIATRILADFLGAPRGLDLFARMLGKSPAKGAETPLYLAASPEVEGITGKYFVKKRQAATSPESYDREAARRLWQVSEELSGLRMPPYS
jgi:NAD(P)-dependent dehydrogenase (short-subunit alcohol dehydrogenase family)